MSKNRDLTTGNVPRLLVSVSAPMSLGIFGVLSVGLADSFFLARDGEGALAAIGFIYPVIVALTSLSIGLSAGTNAVISQAQGRGDRDTGRLALHAMALACGLATLTALAVHLAAPLLFALMGAKGRVLDGILAYIPWWCLSFVPMVTGMALTAVFRAGGRTGIAATVMMTQSLLNIALDPLFIFGLGPVPALGIEGAGIATFLARLAGFGLILVLALRGGVLTLCNPAHGLLRSVRRIGRVGAPAALSNAINPTGMAAVTAAVALVGDAAVAGFGAATRVQSLLFVPMLALSAGIGPVIGQNWGAERTDRAREAVRASFLICTGYGALLALAMALFATPIAAIMTAEPRAADFAATYLRLASLSFFGYGILVTANAAMNARDRALWSMTLSAARIGLVYIPGAWLGVWLAGYGGIVAAVVAANLAAVWGALVACRATGLLALDWGAVRGPARALARRLPRAAAN